MADQCPATLVLESGRVLQCQSDEDHPGRHYREFVAEWQGVTCDVEALWLGDHR